MGVINILYNIFWETRKSYFLVNCPIHRRHFIYADYNYCFTWICKWNFKPILGTLAIYKLGLSITNTGEGNGTPLQYSCLENPMDGGAWWATVHGLAKSQTWLSDFTLTFHFHALEKEMATHSSVLAWRIPGTAEPGGLPTMGLHRVRHDWSNLAAAAAAAA